MSGFIPQRNVTIDFDGDTVSVTLKTLSKEAYLKIMPHLKTKDDVVKMSFADQADFMRLSMEILPEHVTSLTGLIDGNGSPVSSETVFTEAYFFDLVGDIFNELMNISRPSHEEVDALKKQSQEPAQVSPSAETLKSVESSAQPG